jgi:hypothetical protein
VVPDLEHRQTPATQPYTLGCAVAVLREVCIHSNVPSSPSNSPVVWGVIWLIIAAMYFAAGILVGLAVFKVFYPTLRHALS